MVFDTSRLVPEARLIVEAAAAIYLRRTQPWFIGLAVHGSALKGGFIPGCSDIDLQLFLDEQAFEDQLNMPFATYVTFQRDLAQIDPVPFRYIQGLLYHPTFRPIGTGTRSLPSSCRKAPDSRSNQSAVMGVC